MTGDETSPFAVDDEVACTEAAGSEGDDGEADACPPRLGEETASAGKSLTVGTRCAGCIGC